MTRKSDTFTAMPEREKQTRAQPGEVSLEEAPTKAMQFAILEKQRASGGSGSN